MLLLFRSVYEIGYRNLFAEISLQQTGKRFSVTGLIACHFMHGVVDRIKIVLLGELGKLELAGSGAVFGVDAHLKILLGAVGHDLAEEFGKLGGVLGFFKSGLFPIQTDLGITLAVGNAGHSQIHADFAAFSVEVGAQFVDDMLLDILRHLGAKGLANTDDMLGGPGQLTLHFGEAGAGDLALGAELGRRIAFVNVTANRADPFFYKSFSPL